MDLDQAYADFLQERSPQTRNKVVTALRPTIDYHLSSLNATGDPQMRNKALTFAAKAVDSYDPQYGAALPTWVSQQMSQLKRAKRQSGQTLKIPERIQLEAFEMERATREFEEENEREPNLGELADRLRLPISRLAKVQAYQRKTMSDSNENLPPGEADRSDFLPEAMDYVYQELGHIDRKIMEHRLGYGGSRIMDGPSIIEKLRIDPSQLSRRSARISKKLLEIQEGLEKTYG